MRFKILLILSVFFITGCSSKYSYTDLQSPGNRLDPTKGVIVSIPKDGWYENTQYRNSGRMTANAVRAVFSKYTSKVDFIKKCHGDDCLETIDPQKYGYYVKPEILHWEDRATEWSSKPDKIEIQLAIYDVVTKEELANSSYTGKSKWATLGGDHPQDLLSEPTNNYVKSLYQ